MANKILGVLVNGGFTSINSQDTSLSLLEVVIGASGLIMKETSGNFDFAAKKITNMADGTANDHAASKGQMDTELALKIDATEKASVNGVATLDGGGKIPANQLPSTVMDFKGSYNANTNTPSLSNGTGDSGDVYRVGTAGSRDFGAGSITFGVGDWVMYNGTIWEKADNTDDVNSVNSKTGIVVLVAADLNYTQAVTGNWTLADASSIKATLDEVGSRVKQNETDIASNDTDITALQGFDTDLGSTANAKGASKVALEDSAGKFTAGDVEAALNEVKVIADQNESDLSALSSPTKSFTNGDGSAHTIRKLVILEKSSGDMKLATKVNANVDETLGMVADASIAAAAAGNYLITPGQIVSGFTAEALGPRYANTSGDMTATPPAHNAGDNVYEVGRFLTATEFLFNPRHITKHA